MPSLLEKLAGGRALTLGRAAEVAAEVLRSPDAIDELFDGIAGDDEIIRDRAIDALEKVSRERPDLLQPYKKELLTRVALIDHWLVRSHLCQIVSRLANLTPRERRQLLIRTEAYLTAESSIVKATALDCLVQLSNAADFEAERAHVTQLVAHSAAHGDTPALRARARLMQRQLAKLARASRVCLS